MRVEASAGCPAERVASGLVDDLGPCALGLPECVRERSGTIGFARHGELRLEAAERSRQRERAAEQRGHVARGARQVAPVRRLGGARLLELPDVQ